MTPPCRTHTPHEIERGLRVPQYCGVCAVWILDMPVMARVGAIARSRVFAVVEDPPNGPRAWAEYRERSGTKTLSKAATLCHFSPRPRGSLNWHKYYCDNILRSLGRVPWPSGRETTNCHDENDARMAQNGQRCGTAGTETLRDERSQRRREGRAANPFRGSPGGPFPRGDLARNQGRGPSMQAVREVVSHLREKPEPHCREHQSAHQTEPALPLRRAVQADRARLKFPRQPAHGDQHATPCPR